MTDDQIPELDSFSVVLLRSGPRAGDFSDQELDDLQTRHVTYMNGLRDDGFLLINGPFVDQPDETLRGFCIFTCSLDEARSLAEGDPSVRAGRLAAEAFTWMVPRGKFSPLA